MKKSPAELAEAHAKLVIARADLQKHVQPRDDFERAIIQALGDISWAEAMAAITEHREEKRKS